MNTFLFHRFHLVFVRLATTTTDDRAGEWIGRASGYCVY